MLKDKIQLIETLEQLAKVDEFEKQLQSTPIELGQLSTLPGHVRLGTMDYTNDLANRGLIVPDALPPVSDWIEANRNQYAFNRSSFYQMDASELRIVNQTGLLNTGITIYPDVDEKAITHYNFWNKNNTQHSTGSNEAMVNVTFITLDKDQSELNYQLVLDANDYYKSARTEIEYLLANLDSMKAGQFNTQYLKD